MSSPLDGRIRTLAREEAAALLQDAAPGGNATEDRVASLEQAVTSLHGTVLHLEARLDALDQAAGPAGHAVQEGRPAARRTRKTSE